MRSASGSRTSLSGTRATRSDHAGWEQPGAHVVQFYEDERFLSLTVADYLAGGLAVGDPVLVIATKPHREAFASRLVSHGYDLADLRYGARVTWLDARETLSTFMTGSLIDGARFRATVGTALDRSLRGSDRPTVRAYGEMVDLLWKDGNVEGAIRLEQLWNELADSYGFSLLCAYAMGNFPGHAHADDFERVCRHHSRVIPTERYTEMDADARLVEISILQQCAHSLEVEIERRKDLERRLRDALADREGLLSREQAARADAESANRAKNEFLAVMSHELRTPLNAIAGHVQLIEMGLRGPVNDAQREALDRVQRNQQHLLALINDVLNLVRIETGRVEYVLEDIALEPMLADVAATIEPLLAERDLALELDGSAETEWIVRADRERVQQILLNLLSNAIKFTPAGGRITVETLACLEVPAMNCVRVRDTGIGIPAGKLETIFEPFVQLGARATSREGVGLGLAISRDLARGMRGDLTAASRLGEGSTFTLILPRAQPSNST